MYTFHKKYRLVDRTFEFIKCHFLVSEFSIGYARTCFLHKKFQLLVILDTNEYIINKSIWYIYIYIYI